MWVSLVEVGKFFVLGSYLNLGGFLVVRFGVRVKLLGYSRVGEEFEVDRVVEGVV